MASKRLMEVQFRFLKTTFTEWTQMLNGRIYVKIVGDIQTLNCV